MCHEVKFRVFTFTFTFICRQNANLRSREDTQSAPLQVRMFYVSYRRNFWRRNSWGAKFFQ